LEIINRATAKKLEKVRIVGRGINEIIHISEALEQAEEQGLDLVLVSDDVKPPVVRIQDFKKIEYEKKKARKGSKSNQVLKELQFKVNISEHDLTTKVNKIQTFLSRGDKVKIMIRLKGRERENPERAEDLVKKITAQTDCKVVRIPGPQTIAILEPVKK
tara:strand:- start:1347 stop:1826 length:480 start_codon:yes stop_codon:yes gene_type:complete